jgi:hypothetical protein
VLLAVVFENYKKRVEGRSLNKSESRIKMIRKYFQFYDTSNRGVLQTDEAKKFFALILDLDYRNPNDRTTFRKVMKVVDIESQSTVKIENVVEFFQLPNFLNLDQFEEARVVDKERNASRNFLEHASIASQDELNESKSTYADYIKNRPAYFDRD